LSHQTWCFGKDENASQANDVRPKRIISSSEDKAGGAVNMTSPGDIIRNREQVYNVCCILKEGNAVETLALRGVPLSSAEAPIS